MTVWIGLFAGINIGNRRMPMKELVHRLKAEGLRDVRTYIASGNVVFGSELTKAELVSRIEQLVERTFGFHSDLFLLSRDELAAIAAANPFKTREHGGKAQHVFFLASPAPDPDLALLESLKAPDEEYALTDQAFFLYAPSGIGRSKLAEKMGRAIRTGMTARNLNTVAALGAMAVELDETARQGG